jgi:hypothetical protein
MLLAPPSTPTPTPGPHPPSFPPQDPATPGDWVWSAVANAWEWLAAQAGPVAALATVLTAVIAVIALTSTARDSRDRSRPVVLALFRLAEHSDTAFDFVVRNYGQSAARKVKVDFKPDLDADARTQPTTKALAERFDARIPLLPPGAEVSNVYWSGKNNGTNTLVNNLKTPDQVTVTITYKRNWLCRYKEVIPLDAEWMGLATHSVSSTSTPGRMKQMAESLGKIADETKASRLMLRDIAESVATDDEAESDEPATGTGGVLEPPQGENRGGAVPEVAPQQKTPAKRAPASRRQRSTPTPKPAEEPKPESEGGDGVE